MATVVDVLARLRADSSGMVRGFNQAESAAKNLNFMSLTLSNTLGQAVYMGIAKVSSGLLSAATGGIKAAADFEQTGIAFTTMLGSAQKADEFLQEMKDFAASTPFELPGLLASSRGLLAMGYAAEEVKPMLTAIGDAAAGLGIGEEGITRITRALGQMKAKGKVSSEELLQMSEVGVPALRILADSAGVTTGQMQDMISKGLVPADEAVKVLVAGLANGTETVKGFGGQMEAQSKTLTGVLSTFKDEARNALTEGIMPALGPMSQALTGLIPAVSALAQGFGAGLGPALADIASSSAPALVAAFTQMGPALTNLINGLGAIVSTGITATLSVLAPIVQKLGPLFEELAGVLSDSLLQVVEQMTPYLPELADAFVQIVRAAMPLIPVSVQLLTAFLPIIPAITAITRAVAPLISGFANMISESGLVRGALGLLVGALAAVKVASKMSGALAAFKTWATGVIASGGLVGNAMKVLKTVMVAGMRAIKIAFATNPIGFLLTAFTTAAVLIIANWDKVKKFLLDSWEKIKSAAKVLGNALKALFGIASDSDTAAQKAYDRAATGASTIGDYRMGKTAEQLKTAGTKLGTTFGDSLATGIAGSGKKVETEAERLARLLQAKIEGIQAKIEVINSARALRKSKDAFVEFLTGGLAAAVADRKTEDVAERLLSSFEAMVSAKAATILDPLKKAQYELKGAQSAAAFEAQLAPMQAAIDGYMAQVTALDAQIEEVESRWAQERSARAEGASAIAEMITSAFGEPSEVQKALSGASASVDSIIATYNKLIPLIEKRYTGLSDTNQGFVVEALKRQTQQLVDLARKRDAVAADLASSQQKLEALVAEQKQFSDAAAASLTKFGSALDGFETGASAASIVETFRSRLQAIKDFAANVNSALAAGVDPTLVRQIVDMGPQAGAAVAAALASATSEEIASLNAANAEILAVAETFGSSLGTTFYGDAVTAAQQMVAGFQSQYDVIVAEMDGLSAAISSTLSQLSDQFAQIGYDATAALVAALQSQRAAILAEIEAILAAMAQLAATQAAGIGISVPAATTAALPAPTSAASFRKAEEASMQKYEMTFGAGAITNSISVPNADPQAVAEVVQQITYESMVSAAKLAQLERMP